MFTSTSSLRPNPCNQTFLSNANQEEATGTVSISLTIIILVIFISIRNSQRCNSPCSSASSNQRQACKTSCIWWWLAVSFCQWPGQISWSPHSRWYGCSASWHHEILLMKFSRVLVICTVLIWYSRFVIICQNNRILSISGLNSPQMTCNDYRIYSLHQRPLP